MDDDYGPGVDLDGRKSRKGGSGAVLPGSEGYNKGASYNLNGTQVDADGNEIRDNKKKDATNELRGGEDAAADNMIADGTDGGLPGLRKKEESGFMSRVTGKNLGKGLKRGKGGVKGVLKKKGPMGMIVGLIFGTGGLMMGAQSLMPFAIQELLIEKFNSIGISSTMSSDAWLDVQLNQDVRGCDLESTKKTTPTGSNTTVAAWPGSENWNMQEITSGQIKEVARFPKPPKRDESETRAPQGATITKNHYVYSIIYGNSDPRNLLIFVDRNTLKQVKQIENTGKSWGHMGSIRYDWDSGHIFLQDDAEKKDACFDDETMEEISLSQCSIKRSSELSSYDQLGRGLVTQGAELRGQYGYLSACDLGPDHRVEGAHLATKEEESSSVIFVYDRNSKTLLKTFYIPNTIVGKAEIEDISFDKNGDLYLFYNMWDDRASAAFYRIPGSVIGTTGGGYYATTDTSVDTGYSSASCEGGLFAFSNYQVESFEKQGLKVVSNVGNITQMTAILYKKGDKYIPVVGSDMLKYDKYTKEDLMNAIRGASGISNLGDPVSAKEALNDPNFSNPYTTASKAWRGGASGWFDGVMNSTTSTKLSLTRNRWARYIARGVGNMNDSFVETAQAAKKLDLIEDLGIEGDSTHKAYMVETSDGVEYYPSSRYSMENGELYAIGEDGARSKVSFDGKVVRSINEVDLDADTIPQIGKLTKAEGGVVKVENALRNKALQAGTRAASVVCGLIEGMASIYTIAAAYQNLQFLNLVTGFLEAVSKVKAGDGASSPIHEYNDNLTTQVKTVSSDTGEEVNGPAKSAMESQGMASLFGAGAAYISDPSVQNVNFESLMGRMSALTKSVEFTAKAFETCGYVKIVTNAVDVATTIVGFIPFLGQATKGAKVIIKSLRKTAIQVALSGALLVVLPIAARQVAELVMKNAATEFFGEDLGNAVISGANKYLGGNATSGGQSPGSRQKAKAYLREKDVIIANEARYQRATRSPFDITSKYTFLGSMAYSAIPLISSGSFGSIIKGFSNLANNSLITISPIAKAVEEASDFAPEGSCPILESSGAVGDAFCNPVIITDTSTIGYSPDEISNIVENMGVNGAIAGVKYYNYNEAIQANLNPDGSINPKSNLAKYIAYCGQRVSPYGLKDAAILKANNSDVVNILSIIPGVDDVIGLIDGLEDKANWKWTTGSQCVADETDEDWEGEYKYYQRYVENMREVENMNPGYESNVTKFGKNYYKENPVDDSFEGTLARFSGMTKEEVSDTLALIEYYQFIAEYKPLERYAFGEPEVEKELKFDNEHTLAVDVMMPLGEIVYADVRNRNFVV